MRQNRTAEPAGSAVFSCINARYIVCKDMNLAKDMQKIADNYMFDSKILLLIKNRDMLEEVALNEIDGVIIE